MPSPKQVKSQTGSLPSTAPFGTQSSPTNKKSILIIEDDDDVSRLLQIRLRNSGYKVTRARNGGAGLKLATIICPDLILLDLMLPGLLGEEICKRIRESDTAPFSATPIIIITAKATDTDRIVSRVLGADIYMTKPFVFSELENNIKKLIGQCNAN
jgi:DNA-binding response OmpR family regulator